MCIPERKKINYLTAKYLAVFKRRSDGAVSVSCQPAGYRLYASGIDTNPERTVSFGNRAVFIDILYQTVCLHRHLHGDYIFYGGIFATTALAAASIVDNIFLLGMVPF